MALAHKRVQKIRENQTKRWGKLCCNLKIQYMLIPNLPIIYYIRMYVYIYIHTVYFKAVWELGLVASGGPRWAMFRKS